MEKKKRRLTRSTAGMIIIAAAVLITAAVLVRGIRDKPGSGLQALINVSTQQGRQKYLSNLGWEIDTSSEKSAEIVVPVEFGQVLEEYNKLQKQQGFDLTVYSGMKCTQYSYFVTNYPGEEQVVATLYIHGRQVVGGDIHSTRVNGFMHTLK